jgi:ABC-type transport system involved in multi-copper enzyme maturation permease subunit
VKYLALLKDSLLEAIDAKVLYVTLGLSCVLTLVVASISFKPLPAEEALQDIANRFNVVYRGRGKSLRGERRGAEYKVSNLQQLNDAKDVPAGDYRFTLTAQESRFRAAVGFWNLTADTDASGASQPPLTDEVCEAFIKNQFDIFGNVDVTRVHRTLAAKGDTIAFEVDTKGTMGPRGWQHQPCLLFGAVPITFIRQSLGFMVYLIEDKLVNGFGAWVGILIGVIITAFFIPNMLRKGTIDLLLAKPIYRTTLLLYKYLGGLTFVLLNSAVAVGGMWLAIGLRSGIWATGFLWTIFVLTFFFAILYAVSTLFAVLTRSAIVSILVTCGVWFLLYIVGSGYSVLEAFRKDPTISKEFPIPEWIHSTVGSIHYVLPRAKDLDILTTKLLSQEALTEGELRAPDFALKPEITWRESLTVSGLFIALMLGLACWRFAWADY